jgi:hypothetical protein
VSANDATDVPPDRPRAADLPDASGGSGARDASGRPQAPAVPLGSQPSGPPDASDPSGTRPPDAPPGDGGPPEGALRVRLRRAPRYRAFTLTGAGVGLFLGILVSLIYGTTDGRFTERALAGYLGVIGLLVGGILGAGAALLAERRAR